MTKRRTTKKTDVVGVYATANGSYLATIGAKHLGTYPTIEQATEVRRAAEQQRGVDPDASNPDANCLKDPRTGRFLPGHKRPPGAIRAVGKQNKITRDLKEGILDAAIRHGEDGEGKGGLSGYMFHLAKDYPKQFAPLLGRMLPLQVTGNLNTFIGAVNINAVPAGHFLNPEDVKRMFPPLHDTAVIDPDDPYHDDNIIELHPHKENTDAETD